MEIEWRRLRADQLRERAKEDAIVIVPVGALEQHGPHLPVEIDSLLGETVALRTARLAAAMEKVVVLPMLWTGLSEHHMSFGGTITLDFPTFFNMIRCVCESVVRHGFRRIVLLNGHGGNENALRVCADELGPKLDVPIVQLTYWYAAEKPISALLERQSNLWHACEAETSMCMALRPELVAEDRIRLAEGNLTPEVADLVGNGIYLWRSLASLASTGAYGYPSVASREKGEKLLEAISRDVAEKICNKELWALPWR
ncbi:MULTISPECIES: creatininase family protein [Bradyrhizobium]|uniref:creatininase family protein n=1 Tax=Bradyrhizobium centrosematis TaxID=1300039 RepID=UPI002167A443|nr:creatininase family protein [Bradyrhizobium centrosematis]MCS3765871.1 creatinine amidohydrolase [Bradyrhizobium centrosematis]MCS3778227.1 creatinine amidohydrolase [Bradyrhizobium centrosematis]